MALVQCGECGRQISDKAAACPQCGAPPAPPAPPPAAALTLTPPQSPIAAAPPKPRAFRPLLVILIVLAVVSVVVAVAAITGAAWLWRAETSDRAAPASAGPLAALSQPQKVVDQKVELNEGQYVYYSFVLYRDARVEVNVTASPKPVDVMLMTEDEAEKFKKAAGALFGGKYTYRQALSSQQLLRGDKTETLPAGKWTIVVMRPKEALIFKKSTAVDVAVTAY